MLNGLSKTAQPNALLPGPLMGEMGGLGAIGNESDSAQRAFISYSLWARLAPGPGPPKPPGRAVVGKAVPDSDVGRG